ncbi:MAG: DUF1682 domain-containing protein [Lachnospiraceae bacterium]|nr:DUF1682 domain-containing protein [Lachnospiraceae bacterium]
MPTLFEQYEKYHYPIDDDLREDLKEKEVEEAILIRDLDEIEEWRREQARKEKEGKSQEAEEQKELSPEEAVAQKEKEERLKRNRKIKRATIGTRNGWIDSDGRFTAYPVQAFRIFEEFTGASRELDRWGMVFPDEPDIGEKFPAVDPAGCYSEVDMGFKDRMEKIKAAQATRPEAVQEYTRQLLDNFDKPTTGVGVMWGRVVHDTQRIRVDTRAAKRAMVQEDSDWFLDAIRELKEDSENIQQFDRLLNVMEYAVGLTDRVPSPEEKQLVEGLKIPLTPELEAKRKEPAKVPETIHVEFADFSSKMEQKYFANPEYWGKSRRRAPKDAPSVEVAEASMEKYAGATADRQIAPLFAQAEGATRGRVNRGDLIIVGGKTVREIMEEKFQQGIKDGSIDAKTDEDTWYKQNLNQMTGNIVSAGLMAGKRVEAFVPDRNGNIPKEPVGITKTGYEPSPLEKVTLNAWERHFARHGRYQAKAAKAVDYQQTMEARERVQLRNALNKMEGYQLAGDNMKDIFFGAWVKENGPLPQKVPGGFSVDRSLMTSLAVCTMLDRGHSLEDVLNPDKLVQQRNEIGKEVVDRMKAGDEKWEAKAFLHGGRALEKELERLAASMDYTNDKEVFSDKGLLFCQASGAMMDIRQEVDRSAAVKDEIINMVEKESPGKGKKAMDEFIEMGGGIPYYANYARDALRARVNLGKGFSTGMIDIATWEAVKDRMAEKRSANPEKPQLELFNLYEIAATRAIVSSNTELNNFCQMAKAKPEYKSALARKAISGELGKAIKMEVSIDEKNSKGESKFSLDVKYNQKKEQKREKLREIVNENLAKEARKERDKEREAAQNAEQKKAPSKQSSKGPSRRH